MTHTDAVSTFATERYLLDEMTDAEREAFEEHYFSCAECADEVRLAGVLKEAARSGLAGATVAKFAGARPRPTYQSRWSAPVLLPWAVAATLALVVGFQTLVVGPGSSIAPQALAPITLRPASRGEGPVVRSRDGFITFAVDVATPEAATELTYDLRTVEGAPVASGIVAAPEGGAPLLLLVPADALRASGQYLLTVGSGPGSVPPEEYRFTVASDR